MPMRQKLDDEYEPVPVDQDQCRGGFTSATTSSTPSLGHHPGSSGIQQPGQDRPEAAGQHQECTSTTRTGTRV
eukprot:9237160-Pyramimonas_sp.AAC.1